jgi:hypothetical protein
VREVRACTKPFKLCCDALFDPSVYIVRHGSTLRCSTLLLTHVRKLGSAFIPDEFVALTRKSRNGRISGEIGKFGHEPRDRPAADSQEPLRCPHRCRH